MKSPVTIKVRIPIAKLYLYVRLFRESLELRSY